jgi:hypothetical protein
MPLFVVEVIFSVERVVCRRDGSLFGSNETYSKTLEKIA